MTETGMWSNNDACMQSSAGSVTSQLLHNETVVINDRHKACKLYSLEVVYHFEGEPS